MYCKSCYLNFKIKCKLSEKARRDVAALAKELHNINYVISTIDTKIETKKNEKHNLLIQSKVKYFFFVRREFN